MTHLDIQQAVVFLLVAAAAYSIGRRLWSQALAFRSRPLHRTSKRRGTRPATIPPSTPTLIQIQVKPPVHLKRPPTEGP